MKLWLVEEFDDYANRYTFNRIYRTLEYAKESFSDKYKIIEHFVGADVWHVYENDAPKKFDTHIASDFIISAVETKD